MKPTKKTAKQPIMLTPAQLTARQHQLLIVDIRGWFEYWMGHVPGAQQFSLNRILKDVAKDQAIAIICLSGHRSAIAAQQLVAQGYQKVYNLQGGLIAWRDAGYVIQRGSRA
jgi:rhodanese-related sulfurtransferase